MQTSSAKFRIFENVSDLSQISDAAIIRTKVFVEEQEIPAELEFDNYDFQGTHVVIYNEETPIGTGRLIFKEDKKWYIGRIAILKEWRGKSHGKKLVEEIMKLAKNKGINEIFLHSQVYALSFYEKLGWKAFGEAFEEDGILHKEMVANL